MNFRVRTAGIILNDKQELLMVLHKSPHTGETWWGLPGGGIEGTESAEEAVVREVREECGIICVPEKLVYVREFYRITEGIHHVELFFKAAAEDYNIIKGIDPEVEAQFIDETRFLSRAELEATDITIYPENLRDSFWSDLEEGFNKHTVYLGLYT